ncbi:MAG: peptidoglycan DD-metalloendopeptidase family protein [Deltaproteobacteria bacterium]|nr:peptidoglycan DD-metalloendopeptidase family protein [Deltaproteobacteria bacterium]
MTLTTITKRLDVRFSTNIVVTWLICLLSAVNCAANKENLPARNIEALKERCNTITSTSNSKDQKTRKVILRAGETLWRVAQSCQVSVEQLVKHNKIEDPTKVYVGMELLIPEDNTNNTDITNSKGDSDNTKVEIIKKTIESTKSPKERKIILQAGETLWRLANRYGVSVSDLAKRNDINDPKNLHVGMVLFVPNSIDDSKNASIETPKNESNKTDSVFLSTSNKNLEKKPSELISKKSSTIADKKSFLQTNKDEVTVKAIKKTAQKYALLWPVDGSIIARFGKRHGVKHDGIDIAAPAGTAVRAAADGRVIFSARHGGYGNLVIIRHNKGLVTIYAHNRTNSVRRGDHVTAGQIIAHVGKGTRTGKDKLHFEVRKGTTAVDPMRFLPP